jgi:YidC/Oxa1 family membrane protein insertase
MFATFLQPLVDLNDAILKFWHDNVGLSWGASIIGLTVVIRAAILPLTFRQVRSMQALQRLQPEMKRIQERYKDDKQRQQQEMMKFYQEHGVNPLASCLPLLLQLPFFLSLFYLLRSSTFKEDIKGEESFLFIPNLAKPLTGHPAALITMIVLYVVTQLISTMVSTMSADPNQRRLMLALPFVFVFFVFRFQAGLLVYWVATNTWTIGQQLFIKRFLPPPEPLPGGAVAVAGGGGGGGGDGKGGGGRVAKPKPAPGPSGANGGDGGNAKAPPPSPRKRKKRSGRRR